jgi:hypothetical protein
MMLWVSCWRKLSINQLLSAELLDTNIVRVWSVLAKHSNVMHVQDQYFKKKLLHLCMKPATRSGPRLLMRSTTVSPCTS